nr:nitrate reductase molybdenum cofactor assembly chaperone [Microlunatus panaciterrae]
MRPDQLTIAWQSVSLLLDYPDQRLLEQTTLIRNASAELPDEVGRPLREFLDYLQSRPPEELAAEYVRTFDHQKKCCLFLTYFTSGDTRKRGIALLRFKQTYLRSGLVLGPDELPDHLSVVLEYAATTDQRLGWKLLLDYRAGFELLRLALAEASSPWALVADALRATLPPLRGDDWEAVVQLAEQGPPEEDVGLEAFAPPEYMPVGSDQYGRGGYR